jgi:hypothetical protein
MSSALAIGAVTAVIKSLIENDFVRQGISGSLGGTPAVTVLSPNPEGTNAALQDQDRLNLFMFQTSPNAGWRNVDLPSRDGNGNRASNPPLAVDLHYLITAYSKIAFHAEIILGYAMQTLHETPVLTRNTIRATLQNLSSSPAPAEQALSAADLAEQVELIKITPQVMSTEEMSRLWSAIQTQYRPTTVYQASVVLIESRYPVKSALPVRDRNLIVMPFKRPVITAVSPQVVSAADSVTLQGQNLKAAITRVRFGAVSPSTPNPADLTDVQIRQALPTGLLAGINTVQVIHLLDFETGSPAEPHRGFESNVAAFMLAPSITTPSPPALLSIAPGATLTLSVAPAVERSQRVALLVDDRAIAIPSRPATDPPTSTQLDFPIPADFSTGIYLLRLQVDGAESPLQVDPVSNQYIGPKLEIKAP